MIRVTKSVLIHRSAEDVFEFVSNQENAPRWQNGLVEVRRLTDGPPRVGTRHAFVRTFMGKQLVAENEFVEFDPPRRVAFRVTTGPMPGGGSYVVEADAEGARLTSTVEMEASGFLSLAEPLVARTLRRDVEANLARLKGMLESSPVGAIGGGRAVHQA